VVVVVADLFDLRPFDWPPLPVVELLKPHQMTLLISHGLMLMLLLLLYSCSLA
jgi:hypothetical protein